jgi:hypothetical protein
MFLNNSCPKEYAMQMQNLDVLTHIQMKQQVNADKFIEAQTPEIEGLAKIGTFECIPKRNFSPKTRYLDLILTYIRKWCTKHDSASMEVDKYKA